MAYRLRYQAHDLELPIGDFVIGRSVDCQLSLDDPLVSRRHATIRVRANGVSVQDLGSRNGVLVNGAKIEGERELSVGDKVSIGSQEMLIQSADEPRAPAAANEELYRRATQTLAAGYVGDLRAAVAEAAAQSAPVAPTADRVSDPPAAPGAAAGEASRSMQSFKLLGGVADKALALGRAEEAERILQSLLLDVLARAKEGVTVDPMVAESAAKYAARLAGATTRGTWVDYVIELYRCLRRPVPAQILDELYTVVRKVKSLDLALLRAYLADLRSLASSLGPAQRFLIQRLEGSNGWRRRSRHLVPGRSRRRGRRTGRLPGLHRRPRRLRRRGLRLVHRLPAEVLRRGPGDDRPQLLIGHLAELLRERRRQRHRARRGAHLVPRGRALRRVHMPDPEAGSFTLIERARSAVRIASVRSESSCDQVLVAVRMSKTPRSRRIGRARAAMRDPTAASQSR
ncbi:MAG: FHA domain-containing protein [Byssovorax sp.]